MSKPDVRDQRIPQILNAAALAFSKSGVDGASIAQIAKNANLSKATIYHYFNGKEDLIVALVRFLFEEDQGDIASLVNLSEKASIKILNYVSNLIGLLYEKKALYPVFAEFKVISMRNIVIKEILSGYFEGYVKIFEKLIQQGIDSREFKPKIKAFDAALTLTALIEGAILLYLNFTEADNNTINISIDFFIDSLKR